MIKNVLLTNNNKYDTISLDTTGNRDYVLKEISIDSPDIKFYDYRVPRQIGTTNLGVEIGVRVIKITGYVIPTYKDIITVGMD